MSTVGILTRSHPQRGRCRRGYKRSLPVARFDGRFSGRSRMATGFRQPERARSTVVNLLYNHLQRAPSPLFQALPAIQYP